MQKTEAQRLRDAILAYMVYTEGVRNWQALLWRPTAAAIERDVRDVLRKSVANFATISKARLTLLARSVRSVLLKELRYYKTLMLRELQIYLGKASTVMQTLLTAITGQSYEDAAKTQTTAVFGTKAANGTKAGSDLLWASIATLPNTANGLTLEQTLDAFNNNVVAQFMRQLNVSYSNNSDADALETALFDGVDGNKSIIDKLGNGAKTAGSTAFAFVSAQVNQAVSSVYYGHYQWCSVMDSRTTEICQSRNDQIYVYGQGPQPPAHENCRSTIVPYDADNAPAPDLPFDDWIDGIPDDIRNDMFAPNELKPNVINPADARSISPDDFGSKVDNMLF